MNTALSDVGSFLVIDDEEAMREACTRTLETEGYKVVTAADGQRGMEIVREQAPDVVLVDLNLPKLPGMAILDELGRLAPDTVKVVITAYATVSSALEAVRHGAYDFLPKPFTPSELRVIASRALEHRRLLLHNRQLEKERDKAKRRFLELVTSEVRGPLMSARAQLGSLDNMLADRPAEQGVARQASNALDRLLDLVARWQQNGR